MGAMGVRETPGGTRGELHGEVGGGTRAEAGASARPERRLVWLLGPAFVAAIAYVDPGNVAANLTAGSQYGYLLVWVLVVANAMAVLVQYLSAKLGIVTGRSLPELLGERMPRAGRLLFWAQAEVVAIATDLAEVVGGAIALQILFGVPLVVGGVIVGVASMGLLAIQSRRGQRPFEFVIVGLLVVITVGFVTGLFFAHLDAGAFVAGLVPRFDGAETVLLAASMLGATVMPHAIYLHSGLSRDRHWGVNTLAVVDGSRAAGAVRDSSVGDSSVGSVVGDSVVGSVVGDSVVGGSAVGSSVGGSVARGSVGNRNPAGPVRDANATGPVRDPSRVRRLLRATTWDVWVALALAGSVNIAMLVLASASLRGVGGTDTIEGAHAAIVAALGPGVGVVFGIGLLASGLASSSVGCYAGAAIMEGLLHVRVPLLLRRGITLLPALAVLASGFDPTQALVLSQIVLSLGIPFAIIPLVALTGRRRLMGEFVNHRPIAVVGWIVTGAIVLLNVALVVLTFDPALVPGG
jgi:manganese transport protein